MNSNSKKERTYIGAEHYEVCDIPDLISIQTDSYKRFLQKDKVGTKEGPDPKYGLEAVFRSIFPVKSYDENLILEYKGYTLGFDNKTSVNLSEKECRRRSQSYGVSVNAKLVLKNVSPNHMTVEEKDLYFGDVPLMTDRGSFIINGSERVVVSQIHRSPGVIAQYEKGIYSSRVIPVRGSWLEFEIDGKHDGIYAKIDRKKRILVTVFLRCLGLANREAIVKAFHCPKTVSIEEWSQLSKTSNPVYAYRNYFAEDGTKIIRAGDRLSPVFVDSLKQNGINEIEIIDFSNPDGLGFDRILQCFEKEENLIQRDNGEDEPSVQTVITEVYAGIQQNEPPSVEKALQEIGNMFFDKNRYDLGEVGKYKINAKFYPGVENEDRALKEDERTLRLQDIVETIKYLVNVFNDKESVDDIDHLGNRRVRSVGELLENQLKSAFLKLERAIKDKMASQDLEKVKISDIVASKVITSAIRDFFQSSQLSQFMDQVNPLSELTHKRRITALGPGGLNRERASFEVRDVHYTHYGRMCPIETPEGQNIGLIVSLANYTKVTENGFLETPYRRVVNGKATKEIRYLDATEEEHYYIAQASAKIDKDGNFAEEEVSVRKKGEYSKQKPADIEYMDVSPRQVISVAASLIPFLEHDDANRALMGSNMQRQAVPLVFPEAPRIGTGMEAKAAYDSGVLVKANRGGKVSYVSASEIRIEADDDSKGKKKAEDVYYLGKNIRTNAETCFNQRPIVSKGDVVKAGDVIADGPACDNGELALGRNILVGFVPWNGYNYEDAVLISERVVKEDLFTSIHISEHSVNVRETKQGTESLTRDLPNVSSEAVRNLDSEGIIKIGTKVKSGDILVGKVTPKNEGDNSPEVKLLNAVFGDKSKETRNSSLKMPHGGEGVVIRVDKLSRKNGDDLGIGTEEVVKVQVANKRKLMPGDKMAGRHGNKGVVSRILPVEDMPFMEDGTPLDVCLNPLGVPSRMNIGQLMETELGWAAVELDKWFSTPVFQSASMEQIQEQMRLAGLSETSKVPLYDGRTGEKFVNDVFCGYIYYLKLNHLVDDKVHARSTGPYSMVTQQPLGGRAKFGGQRFGEMEVWALEAYGAANVLEEILTIKSDDMNGRMRAYDNIVKGELAVCQGSTEAFKVLIQEVRGLCLDMQAYDSKGRQIPLTEKDEESLNRKG